MNRLQIMIALMLMIFSLGLQAGVKEKKAKRGAEEAADAAAEVVKSACGNESLDFVMHWEAFDGYSHDSYSKHDAMRLFGFAPKGVGNILANLCADPDYKEEIAKLTKVNLSGTSTLKAARAETSYTIKETEFNLVLIPTGAIGDYHKKAIKSAF